MLLNYLNTDNDYHTIANSLNDIKFYKKCIIKIKYLNGLFDSIYVNNVLIFKDIKTPFKHVKMIIIRLLQVMVMLDQNGLM